MKNALSTPDTFGKFSLRLFLGRHVSLVLISSFMFIFSYPSVCQADTVAMLEKVGSSMVSISTHDREGNAIRLGSGFAVRKDGAIATTYHALSNRRDLVIIKDGREYAVKGMLHEDAENDIIVLKVDHLNLTPVTFGDSDRISAGEKVYIATVQGRTTAFVEGVLHKIHDIDSKQKLFLISIPMPEEHSGSPVLNANGDVIGIATFIIEDEKNLSFAFPVSSLREFLSGQNAVTRNDYMNLSDYRTTAGHWFNRGAAYESVGRYREAIGAFTEASRLSRDNPEIHYHLGIAYEKSGIYSFAAQEYQRAASIKTNDADKHYRLGVAYTKLGMLNDASAAFREAIRIKPDFAKAYSSLGFAYFKAGRHQESLEASLKAVQLDPDDSVGQYGLGVAYSQLNMTKEALSAFRKAIALNPDNADAHFALGALSVLVERDTSLKEYEILRSLNPEYANELLRLLSVPSPAEIYSVQVGAFAIKSNAVALTESLRQKGYDAFIREEPLSSKKIRYTVLVGNFEDRESARTVSSAITRKEGTESFVVRH